MPKTLRHSILFVLFGMLGLSPHAQWQWASTVSDAGNSIVTSTVLDGEDNVYVAGYYVGQLTAGDDTLSGYGGNYDDIFVAKYDAQGNLKWIKTAGGDNEDQAWGIALDADNNIYVVGSFYEAAIFGEDLIIGNGNKDIFLVKYSNDGE